MDRPDQNGGPSASSRNPDAAKHFSNRLAYCLHHVEEGLVYVRNHGAGQSQIEAAASLQAAVSMLESLEKDIDSLLGGN